MKAIVKEIRTVLAGDTESMYECSLEYQVSDNDIDCNYYRQKFEFYKKDLKKVYDALDALYSSLYMIDLDAYYNLRDTIKYYLRQEVTSENFEAYKF